MKDNRTKNTWLAQSARKIAGGLLLAAAALALSGVANAQKNDEITFNLVPNPDTVGCLRANNTEEPRARATVIRGKVNDTLILDLDGIRPGLAFDLFTVQRSPLLADGSKDPAFTNVFNGSFGLAWSSPIFRSRTATTAMCASRQFCWMTSLALILMCGWLRRIRSMSASGLTIRMRRRPVALIRRNQSRSTANINPAPWQ